MKRLTPGQAGELRKHRPAILKVCSTLAELSCELSDICPHGMSGGPPRDEDCPGCRVYYAVAGADTELNELEDDLDRMLLAGPEPGEK